MCLIEAIKYIFHVFVLVELILNGHRSKLIEEEVLVCLVIYGPGSLIILDICLNSFKYIDLLEERLPSALKRFSSNQLNDQEDNARVHLSKMTQDFFQQKQYQTAQVTSKQTILT